MARKSDIQYVRFYTDGSAARQLEPAPIKKRKPPRAPRKKPQEKMVIRLDPVPVLGLMIAAVMFVMIVAGAVQLMGAQAELKAMSGYVAQLQQENIDLNDEYKAGYDLDAVQEMALALGMIPIEQADQETITVQVPEPVEEPTFWERIADFFQGLFA